MGNNPLAESNPEAVDDATRAQEESTDSTDARLTEDYEDATVEELQAEVNKRGFEVEGTGSDGNVLKSDLVEALEEDDEENA